MKIYLIAFRGTGGFNNPKYQNEPGLVVAGHVGIRFEDDNHIYGFHPTPEAVGAVGGEREIAQRLKRHEKQPGSLQDDTNVFIRAHELYQQGERTEVLELVYDVSEDEFSRIKTTAIEWFSSGKVFWYNFPRHDGTFSDEEYNCAIFPKLLGLELPSVDGHIAVYTQVMREKGATAWIPTN